LQGKDPRNRAFRSRRGQRLSYFLPGFLPEQTLLEQLGLGAERLAHQVDVALRRIRR
jgi:hypothetical protein